MNTEIDTDNAKHAEYTEPTIVDYGTLQDLTAAGGTSFSDVPQGDPGSDASTP
jgi:hypothetical protein